MEIEDKIESRTKHINVENIIQRTSFHRELLSIKSQIEKQLKNQFHV